MVTIKYLLMMFIVVVSVMANDENEVSVDGQCCEVCPQLWIRFGVNCYRMFSDLTSWDDAEAHCKTFFNPFGIGHLASVHSEEENHFLFELHKAQRPQYTNDVRSIQTWIGLKDDVWSDGSHNNYRYQWYGTPTAHPCLFMTQLISGVNGWNKAASDVAHGRCYICKLHMDDGSK